jgi:hypothetical protein
VSVGNDAKGDKESNLEIKELFTPSPPHSAEQKGEIADPGSHSGVVVGSRHSCVYEPC